MKHHQITLENLQEWISETSVTYASSTRENKSLTCHLNGTIQVIHGNVTVWEGVQLAPAIEVYNSITEKWVNPLKDFKI
jgi:hypothetical protein